jgi:dTDP-4-amino-4,6-dideoxygalactose transaminase
VGAQTDTTVPFVDLRGVNGRVKSSVLDAIGAVIDSGSFTNGPAVAEFEAAFAGFAGTAFCVGVSSGLDALRLALIAAGVTPGDKVVVPAHTFIATFEAVVQAGGVPVPVDVTADNWDIDVTAAEEAFADGARFALPVHLYGQIVDMRALAAAAARHGATIVEDAAQAHGASRDGVRPGALSAAAAFSFYPAKNLGAFGDAGAVVTNSPGIADRVRALRQHGEVEKYHSVVSGWTARLDTLQAVVLTAKLRTLDDENRERRTAAAWYHRQLGDIPELTLPTVARDSDHVWHLYVVRTEDPLALAGTLGDRGIATGRHYPEPPHLSAAFHHLGYGQGSFPISEAIARECLSLPLFPGITEEQLAHVSNVAHEHFARG